VIQLKGSTVVTTEEHTGRQAGKKAAKLDDSDDERPRKQSKQAAAEPLTAGDVLALIRQQQQPTQTQPTGDMLKAILEVLAKQASKPVYVPAQVPVQNVVPQVATSAPPQPMQYIPGVQVPPVCAVSNGRHEMDKEHHPNGGIVYTCTACMQYVHLR